MNAKMKTNMNKNEIEHQSIMVNEVLEGLNIQKQGIYIDATFGRGGHTKAILEKLNQEGRVYALDKDPDAELVAQDLSANDSRFSFKRGSFSGVYAFCQQLGLVGKIAGILMDLGVSSPQLDTAARGFSFRLDGPLDMRMDPTVGISAAEWINSAEETEISEVLKEYGEERFHRRMARAIINARSQSPITTTLQLAEIITKANPAWERHKNPATRSFQAIRIYINRELEDLALGLEQALEVLLPKGRLVVISFHSLEDRIVKRFIQKNEQGDIVPSYLPLPIHNNSKKCHRVGKKIKASMLELAQNPRARSAILRVAEKEGE
jgi:16S rRNA (cytosine1402-N4)-methyltransferase